MTDEAVYVGGERLTRIELDGAICCQADLGYDEAIPSPVVADGLVLVAAGGVLYGVDAGTLEEQWSFDPADGRLYEQSVAVADGAVFAASQSRLFARELADGSERWTDDDPTGDDGHSRFTAPTDRQTSYPVATDDVVAVGSADSEPGAVWESGYVTLYDAETGVKRTRSERAPITPGPIVDGRFFGRTTHDLYGFDRGTGGKNWELPYNMYHVSSAVVADGTVYAGVTVNGEAHRLEEMSEPETGVYAFDENGEVEWTIATDERPTLALVDGTLYAGGESLIAIRPEATESGDESEGEGDEDSEDDGGESADDSENSSDDGGESGDDGEDPEDDGESGDDGGDSSDDGGAESDDEANDDEQDAEANESNGGTGADDADGGTETIGGTENADDGTEAATDGTESTANGSNNESDGDDGMPGFTVGAGIAGGALTLEALRRRATDGNGATGDGSADPDTDSSPDR